MRHPWLQSFITMVLTGASVSGVPNDVFAQGKQQPESKDRKVVFQTKDKIKVNVHPFELKAGRHYYVFVSAKGFYPLFRVETDKGRLVGVSRSYGRVGDKVKKTVLPIKASKNGRYQIAIAAPFSGSLTARDLVYSVVVRESPATIFQHKGQLTKKDDKYRFRRGAYHKSYKVKLDGEKTYLIELETTKLNGVVFLEDSKGRPLRMGLGRNKRSQIIYRPQKGGTYRVIATSSSANQIGEFEISVRPFPKLTKE